MNDIFAVRDETLTEIGALRHRDAKLRYIIKQGKAAPRLPESKRTADHQVAGCSAATWMVTEKQDDRYAFVIDSEAVMVRGVMQILLRVYNGRTADEIRTVPPSFLAEAGILDTLSASRRNGIAQMCERLRSL